MSEGIFIWLSRLKNARTTEESHIAEDVIRSMFQDKNERIEELEAEIERLDDLKYRHECLKSMYSDEMNYMNDSQSVDNAIDDFISEEESHS